MNPMSAPAAVDTPRAFMNSGNGAWAGQRWLEAVAKGQGLSPAALRTLDTLRRDEWKFFDDQLVEAALSRMTAVPFIIGRGLVKTITNGLAKTVYQWERIGDMNPAIVSLDGVTRAENDTVEFDMAGLPLPITHKDWYLNLRRLLASRDRGEALDATYTRVAGRKIGEETESMFFNGGKTFLGLTIYGILNHPDVNTANFEGTGGSWSEIAKTGAQITADVGTLIAAAEADRMYGPYVLFIGSGMSLKMGEDYKAESDRTVRERVLAMDRIEDIILSDSMPADTVALVQMTDDVVAMIEGEPLQTVQWDIHGGFQINFKGFQIMVPLVRSDSEGRIGVVVMTEA